jgi:hypothetical protein
MKGLWSFVLLGACASGTSAVNGADDAPTGEVDAPPIPGDADEVFVDAAIDARPDAPPPPDATVTPPDAAPPDACVPVVTEKLVNPVLDLAPLGTGWTEVPLPVTGGPFPIITSDPINFPAHSAPNHAWFGGAVADVGTASDQLFQDVTFPADATNFVVSGFFAVQTDEGTGVFDRFRLDITQVNGTQIENVLTLNNTTVAGSYTAFSKTLGSNLAGQTVRIRATSTHDDSLVTNFFLDSFSVRATFCP